MKVAGGSRLLIGRGESGEWLVLYPDQSLRALLRGVFRYTFHCTQHSRVPEMPFIDRYPTSRK